MNCSTSLMALSKPYSSSSAVTDSTVLENLVMIHLSETLSWGISLGAFSRNLPANCPRLNTLLQSFLPRTTSFSLKAWSMPREHVAA